jgi:hypothetical protein
MTWSVHLTEEDAHVIPDFGALHMLSDECWCEPTREKDAPHVVVHHSAKELN